MKIALINENSQVSKNSIIYNTLLEVSSNYNHTVFNYGMSENTDTLITYPECGLLAAILLNSHAVDFVITGCGTGEGAMVALNSFPGVLCGYVNDPTDAILFLKINNGNSISIPYAKGFGWARELDLKQIFNNLFTTIPGSGYPIERKESEENNKIILDGIRNKNFKSFYEILII